MKTKNLKLGAQETTRLLQVLYWRKLISQQEFQDTLKRDRWFQFGAWSWFFLGLSAYKIFYSGWQSFFENWGVIETYALLLLVIFLSNSQRVEKNSITALQDAQYFPQIRHIVQNYSPEKPQDRAFILFMVLVFSPAIALIWSISPQLFGMLAILVLPFLWYGKIRLRLIRYHALRSLLDANPSISLVHLNSDSAVASSRST